MSESRPNRQCLDLEEAGFNLITSDAHQVLRGAALNADKLQDERCTVLVPATVSALMGYNGVISI